LSDALLHELQHLQWPADHHRPSVKAERYLVLQHVVDKTRQVTAKASPMSLGTQQQELEQAEREEQGDVARQPLVYRKLFELCLRLLRWADPWFARRFTAIAVTRNFEGR
jgi:hypothetical protein